MWISGGKQEIIDNIVHMVLAEIPGGPAGPKGISLFLVPKRRVDAHGTAGAPNNIALAGLNHEMRQRGTTNCLLNFGETGECLGYLIGKPHRSIEYMSHMMNEACIGVGHASGMAALGGYLYSANYAKTRTQGTVPKESPTAPWPSGSAWCEAGRPTISRALTAPISTSWRTRAATSRLRHERHAKIYKIVHLYKISLHALQRRPINKARHHKAASRDGRTLKAGRARTASEGQ